MDVLLEAKSSVDWGSIREVVAQTTDDCQNLMRHVKGNNPKMLGAAVARLLADLGFIAENLGHGDVAELIAKARKKSAKLAH